MRKQIAFPDFCAFTRGVIAFFAGQKLPRRCGPAPLAFVVLLLLSAFPVDLADAFVIQFFVSL